MSSTVSTAKLLAATLLAVTCQVHADPLPDRIKTGKVVRHAVSNDAPYGFVGKDGQITGIEVELVKTILADMGAKSEVSATTFGSMIPGIQANRFDIVSGGIYIRPERCRVVQFSSPTFMVAVGAFVRKGKVIQATSFNQLAQDKSLKFGKLTGGFESKAFAAVGGDVSQISDFNDRTAIAAALKSGRIDVGLLSSLGAAAAVANDPGLAPVSPMSPPIVDGKPFVYYTALAFAKGGDAATIDTFNKKLAGITQSPTYRELLAKYGVPADVIPPADADVAEACTIER